MKTYTLDEWLCKFETLRTGEVSTRTEANYATTMKYLREFFGEDRPLKKIKREDADDFRVDLRTKDIAPPTVREHVIRTIAIFDRAVLRGVIKTNPFKGLAPPVSKPVKDWKELTAAQVAAIVAAAPTPDWKRFLGLCAYAGLRRGEALRLLGGDVDFAARKLRVIPDTGYETTKKRAREVLLAPELEALLDRKADPDLPVCRIAADMNRYVVKIIKKAGVEPFGAPFHTLRKWRAQSWRKQFPEYAVDLMLGHGPEVARDHYVRVPDEVFARVAS